MLFGKTVINIEILVGLPGSGKTYYSTNYKADKDELFEVIDFDKYIGKNISIEEVLKKDHIYDEIFMFTPKSRLIFDGLFTTDEEQEKIVSEWINIFNKEDEQKDSITNIKFIYFKENRGACLKNDSYREKKRQAKVTIKQRKLEKPDTQVFIEKFGEENRINFNIEEKEIYCMTDYDGIFKKEKNNYWSDKLGYDAMVSEEWRTGGNVCGYDGYEEQVEPEERPESFDKFDDLIENICPNITIFYYKKLYKQCVTIQEDSVRDYYGGRVYTKCYCCNLEKLYEMLKEQKNIE